MYARALKMGRLGYEVQYQFVVHPDHLVFDPDAQKLGARLKAMELEHEMPEAWYWVADPSSVSVYFKDRTPETLSEAQRAWVLSDHHERFADSVGYNSYHVFPESEHVAFQLELVSRPLADYGRTDFLRDLPQIFNRCLVELCERGVVGIFPDVDIEQQKMREQINVEIDNRSWSERLPTHEKLASLALGLVFLTRHVEDLPLSEPDRVLVERIRDEIQHNTRFTARYDLITNLALVLEGYLYGVTLTPFGADTLERLLTHPAHIAVLAQCLDNRYCSYLFHGDLEVSAAELAQIQPEDWILLRELGVDPVFLDILADAPQEHLDDRVTACYDVPFLRSSLSHFLDLEQTTRVLRASLLGEGEVAEDARVTLPLCHPRKNMPEGSVYVELRDVHRIKHTKTARYPYEYRRLKLPRGDTQVIYLNHLHPLGQDLLRLFDVATLAGYDFLRRLRAGDAAIRGRDALTVESRAREQLAYLLRRYHRS